MKGRENCKWRLLVNRKKFGKLNNPKREKKGKRNKERKKEKERERESREREREGEC